MIQLRVFTNNQDEYGNPVGIFIDQTQSISPKERQAITTSSGFSECVFVNNISTADVTIYNPQEEVQFAGHALLGTAYYLGQITKRNNLTLQCQAGQIKCRFENGLTWLRAHTSYLPSWNLIQKDDVSQINNIDQSYMLRFKHSLVWAWVNKPNGLIRARTFAPDWGISEDEANGSGSMLLTALINKPLTINHGKGSIIYTKPLNANEMEIGGRVCVN